MSSPSSTPCARAKFNRNQSFCGGGGQIWILLAAWELKTMQCEEIIKLLPAHLDGEVPPAEDAVVRAHLAYCRMCRDEVGRLSETWASLESLPSIRPSAAFRAQFWARIRDESQTSPWWERILVPSLIPTACGLSLWLFGISSGILIFNSKFSHESPRRSNEHVLFAEPYPAGSFSQLFSEDRHVR